MCEFHQQYPSGKEGRETLVISCRGIDAKLVLRQTMWKFHQITLDDEYRCQKSEIECMEERERELRREQETEKGEDSERAKEREIGIFMYF